MASSERSVPEVGLSRCQPGAAALVTVCCADWECAGGSAESPGQLALVLCDGARFERLDVSDQSEEHFALQGALLGRPHDWESDPAVDFRFVGGAASGALFVVTASRQLARVPWPPGVREVKRWTASGPVSPSLGGSLACFAAWNLGGEGLLCAVMEGGLALVADGRGAVVAEAEVGQAGARVQMAEALQDSWALLCCVADEAGDAGGTAIAIKLCGLQTLEVLASLDTGAVEVSHMLPLPLDPGRLGGSVSEEGLLLVCTAPRVLLSVRPAGRDGAPSAWEEGHPDVLPLSALLPADDDVAVASCASAPVRSACLVVLGLSSGSVCLLRSEGLPVHASSLRACGRHAIAPDGASPVVACGFAPRPHAEGEPRPPLFAATRAGGRRLWIAAAEGRGTPPAPSPPEALPGRPRERDEPGEGAGGLGGPELPRGPPRAAACPSPPGEGAPASGSGAPGEGAPASGSGRGSAAPPGALGSDVPGPEAGPLPPWHELEALIEQTTREIAELEDKEHLQAPGEDGGLEPEDSPPIPELPPLREPSPPRIPRVARANRVDPKWARAQRELIDPAEFTREILDSFCFPPPEPLQPCWIPLDCPELDDWGDDREEHSVASLSFDPLEQHVKSLCQPW